MAEMGCCETMTECVVVHIHPIASAPLNKVGLQNDLMVEYSISYTDNFDLFDFNSFFHVSDELCSFDSHPGFQTPLLI